MKLIFSVLIALLTCLANIQTTAAQTNRPKVVVIPLAGDTQIYTGVEPIVVDNERNTISLQEEVPLVFKFAGSGFAVKDLNAATTVETDIWDIKVYDTRNTFNRTTKRFVAPESGYYFFHAVVKQSNSVTNAFFRISFNVDVNSRYSTVVDGDDVRTELSGIYFLTQGREVYVNLRNFSSSENVRIDGFGSYFEGYKIR